jgi:hypothetical protein
MDCHLLDFVMMADTRLEMPIPHHTKDRRLHGKVLWMLVFVNYVRYLSIVFSQIAYLRRDSLPDRIKRVWPFNEYLSPLKSALVRC